MLALSLHENKIYSYYLHHHPLVRPAVLGQAEVLETHHQPVIMQLKEEN